MKGGTSTERLHRDGAVLLEFVLVAPVLFTVIFFCLQIAHVWMARQVVQYASFAAARSMLTAEESEYRAVAQRSAEQVTAWVVMGQADGEPEKTIPGWGAIPGSGAVERKTSTAVGSGKWHVEAEVTLDFGLIWPIAGAIIGWGVNPWAFGNEWAEQRADETGNRHRFRDTVEYPHIRITETTVLSKPFVTLYPVGLPEGGW